MMTHFLLSKQPASQTTRSIHNESGQGMIEFSIILILFIGIFVGVFEIMSLYRQRSDLEYVARNAARQAATIHIDGSTDLQLEVTNLIKKELKEFGYDEPDLVSDDPVPANNKLVVSINTYEYQTGVDDLQTTAETQCVYGDYVSVKVEWDWMVFVFPLDTFFDTNGSGTHVEEHIFKCYRGE